MIGKIYITFNFASLETCCWDWLADLALNEAIKQL